MQTLQSLLREADSYKQEAAAAWALIKEETNCCEGREYGNAYDYMLDLGRQPDLVITEEVVVTLHRLLYPQADADQSNKLQYRTDLVAPSDGGYLPPAPEDLPHLMKHFADQIQSSRRALHPIELAAMAYKRLVDIQPFIEGNCRTAQLLMNVILVNAGYCAVSLPLVQQNHYLQVLSESRRLKDMDPFSKLLAQCVIVAEQDYCQLNQV